AKDTTTDEDADSTTNAETMSSIPSADPVSLDYSLAGSSLMTMLKDPATVSINSYGGWIRGRIR
ncbi:MAG: hypothetical protein AABZ06_08645, partial [Bdellovibrionota bacterium]